MKSDRAVYRVSQIKLRPGEDKRRIPEKIAKKLGLAEPDILDWKIVKESVDARKKPDILLVYTVDFESGRTDLLSQGRKRKDLTHAPDEKYEIRKCEEKPSNRPVVVGAGPCGMFAAYVLAVAGLCPMAIEQGAPVERRVRDVERFWKEGILDTRSNVQFGEGGAGTFSDGKLTTGVKDIRIRKILEVFVQAGADESILYKNRPHIGTDVLRKVVVNIRSMIEELGGEYLFDTKVTDIITENGKVTGLKTEERTIPAEKVILAPGHSARDTIRMLHEKKIPMEKKPFSMGVRIQHPQVVINRAQYGDESLAEILGPADYKLSCRCSDGRGVYTFCMCPGGEVVVASSQEEGVVTNGMSYSERGGEYANSALLADVRVSDMEDHVPADAAGEEEPDAGDDVLAGVKMQEYYEHLAFVNGGSLYNAPETTWKEFREGSSKAEPVTGSLPDFVTGAIREAMPKLGKKLKGFDDPDTLMMAVESRSSSPVRILRDSDTYESIEGLYPAGEGAGYAGGIVSAAADGMRAAEKVIEKIKAGS